MVGSSPKLSGPVIGWLTRHVAWRFLPSSVYHDLAEYQRARQRIMRTAYDKRRTRRTAADQCQSCGGGKRDKRFVNCAACRKAHTAAQRRCRVKAGA